MAFNLRIEGQSRHNKRRVNPPQSPAGPFSVDTVKITSQKVIVVPKDGYANQWSALQPIDL